tara:strand:+ start:2636 stop:3007 length:372 start_codon:yes stop_codon:yes gene_type:complete
MDSLSNHLNEWNKFYFDQNDKFDDKIEKMVMYFVQKKDRKTLFNILQKMDCLEKHTGVCMMDFKQSEMNTIIDIIKKYEGIFISHLGEETGSELHKYEDNIILSSFNSPLLAFDCYTDYITNE